MFCPKCGTEVNNNASFCPKCGAKINGNQQKNAQESVAKNVKPAISDSAKKEYDAFLKMPEKKKKRTVSKLTAKQKKSENHSAKAIIKRIATRLIVALLIFAFSSTLMVGAFTYTKNIDLPDFAYSLMSAIGLTGNDKDGEQTEEEKETPSPDVKPQNEPSDTPDDSDDSDEPDEPENEEPLTPENEEMLNEYNSKCDDAYNAVTEKIKQVGKKLTNEDGDKEVLYETEIDAITAAVEEMYDNDEIDDYEINDDNIVFYFEDGTKCIYALESEGTKAAGSDVSLSIATYEPCKTGDLEVTAADDAATAVDDEFENYLFDHNYDDRQVDFDAISNMGENKIICWSGHGGYSSWSGINLATGVRSYEMIPNEYVQYVGSGDIFKVWTEESSYYGVSVDFFEQCIPDDSMNGSIVFLGACHTCQNSELADVLLEKGALAVLGYSDTVTGDYDDGMTLAFFSRLAQKDKYGLHYSLQEALDYAKDECGEYDHIVKKTFLGIPTKTVDTELVMYTDQPDYTLDAAKDPSAERNIVLVLDMSSSMEGEPLSQTKIAAEKFIQTVEESGKDVGIALVAFSSEANILCDFSKNYAYLKKCVDKLEASGSTNIEDALSRAEDMLNELNSEKNSVVFMTDGEPTEGGGEAEILSVADRIKADSNRHIYTLGFFSDVSNPDESKRLLDEIASEGCHYEVTDAEQLRYFFEDIAGEISGATNFINVIIDCPVDVTVEYDGETLTSKGVSDSARTSFGTITFQNTYEEGEPDTRTKILRLNSDNKYDISIEGNDFGTMDYTIQFMDENGDYSDVRKFENVQITKRTNINATAEKAEESILDVDENGDGEVDYTYVATANSYAKLRDYKQFKTILICCAIFTAVVMLLCDIMRIVNAKKRRELLNILKENEFISIN